MHSVQTLLHVDVVGEPYHYYTNYRLDRYRWRTRLLFFFTPHPAGHPPALHHHSCDISRRQFTYTHTDGNTITMGFSPFKKSDKDSSEARSTTPPEYDNSHERGLPSVAREELEGLTLYEKKCVLINHEIDNNGFGKYLSLIHI